MVIKIYYLTIYVSGHINIYCFQTLLHRLNVPGMNCQMWGAHLLSPVPSADSGREGHKYHNLVQLC